MGASTQSIWQRVTTVIPQLYCSCIESRCSVQRHRECGYWVDCLPVHKAPLGQISSIPHLIRYVRSLLEVKGQSTTPVHRTYCMIVGNYGGHMAFAMDPPFCMVYSLDFINKDDPANMTFRNQENHPVSFSAEGLIVHQLLTLRLHGAWVHDDHPQWMPSHS